MTAGSLIDRSRLLDRLDAAAEASLTLLIGPAGSGKSVLLDQWVSARPHLDLVHVRLDSMRTEPSLFGQSRQVGDADALGRMQPGAVLDDAFVTWCRQQAASGALHLVVDCGATEISAEQAMCLDGVLSARSTGVRLVLAARAIPPLALGHLLTSGELAMIGAEELAFTVDEVRDVAGARLGRDPDMAEITDLFDRTRGWVAGVLCTLGEAVAAGVDRRISVDAATDRIDAFVATEIVDRLDRASRMFLAQIAELEEIQPAVCDAVLERDDSSLLLGELGGRPGLVELVDPNQGIYRLEPLIRGTLRRMSRREQPELVRRVAESATRYYSSRGHRLEAAAHLIELGRYHEAIERLGEFALTSVNAREIRRCRGLVDRVPVEAFRSHPQGLQILASILLILRDGAAVQRVLDELDAAIDPSSADWWANRTFLGGARVVRGRWCLDPGETVRGAETVLAMLDDVPPGVPTGLDSPPFEWTRATMYMHGAQALFRLDRFDQTRRWIERARVSSGRLPTVAVQVEALEALVAATVGELALVEHHAERADRLAIQTRPDRTDITVDAEIARVVVALERNRLDEAQAGLVRLGQMQEFPYAPSTATHIGVLQARLHLARGSLRAGLVGCDELRRSMPDGLPTDSRAAVAAVEARLAVRYGQIGHARRLLQTTPLGRESYAALALLHWLGQEHRALATLLGNWPSSPCVVNRIEYLIFRALQAHRAKRPDVRSERLAEAARVAEPGGFTRVFFDTAPDVVELLRTELRRNHSPDPAVVALLGRLDPAWAGPEPRVGPTFSVREASIVALLPTYLTGVEIAEELGISPSTLKSHQQRIYRKLKVHSRSQAVQRLGELGLIESFD